ncbi:MAG: hypothetical protein U0R80_15160 [Nocardioidaceae bacterium]
MWFFVILAVAVVAFVVWKMRVPILARILGQSEQRIDRHLNGPKH